MSLCADGIKPFFFSGVLFIEWFFKKQYTMKKTLWTLILVCFLSCPSDGMAQRGNRGGQMMERRAEQLADNWKLKGDARTQFLTTYKEYQQELMKHRTSLARPENGDAKKPSEYTDEEANARLTAEFNRKAQGVADAYNRLEVDKKYYEIFSKSLTPQQLVEIFAPVFQFPAAGGQRRSGRGFSGGFPAGGGAFGMPSGNMDMNDDW